MYVYCVITDPGQGEDGRYHAFALRVEDEDGVFHYTTDTKIGISKAERASRIVILHLPVFYLGEILVLETEYEREVNGGLRKPSKWNVSYELYGAFEQALERSIQITRDWSGEGEMPAPKQEPLSVVERCKG